MQILEPGEPLDDELLPEECDFSELLCPRCGCNAIDWIQLPRSGQSRSWWARGEGAAKAKCLYCGAIFGIQVDDEETL